MYIICRTSYLLEWVLSRLNCCFNPLLLLNSAWAIVTAVWDGFPLCASQIIALLMTNSHQEPLSSVHSESKVGCIHCALYITHVIHGQALEMLLSASSAGKHFICIRTTRPAVINHLYFSAPSMINLFCECSGLLYFVPQLLFQDVLVHELYVPKKSTNKWTWIYHLSLTLMILWSPILMAVFSICRSSRLGRSSYAAGYGRSSLAPAASVGSDEGSLDEGANENEDSPKEWTHPTSQL